MGDAKALQMGTSHELGQNFARAFGIDFLDAAGERQLAWTTSWGTSTRMLGGLIMCHGDDDGLRVPPLLAAVQALVTVVKDGEGVARLRPPARRRPRGRRRARRARRPHRHALRPPGGRRRAQGRARADRGRAARPRRGPGDRGAPGAADQDADGARRRREHRRGRPRRRPPGPVRRGARRRERLTADVTTVDEAAEAARGRLGARPVGDARRGGRGGARGPRGHRALPGASGRRRARLRRRAGGRRRRRPGLLMVERPFRLGRRARGRAARFPQGASPATTGSADAALQQALEERAAGRAGDEDVVAALASARLLVPVVAVLGEGVEATHGTADKQADMALVTLTSPDGVRALPVFSSLESLAQWDATARPVPVEARRAAVSAVAEGCDVMVLDPSGPVSFVVGRPALWALGQGRPWLPAHRDPEVQAVLRDVAAAVDDVDVGAAVSRGSRPSCGSSSRCPPTSTATRCESLGAAGRRAAAGQ